MSPALSVVLLGVQAVATVVSTLFIVMLIVFFLNLDYLKNPGAAVISTATPPVAPPAAANT